MVRVSPWCGSQRQHCLLRVFDKGANPSNSPQGDTLLFYGCCFCFEEFYKFFKPIYIPWLFSKFSWVFVEFIFSNILYNPFLDIGLELYWTSRPILTKICLQCCIGCHVSELLSSWPVDRVRMSTWIPCDSLLFFLNPIFWGGPVFILAKGITTAQKCPWGRQLCWWTSWFECACKQPSHELLDPHRVTVWFLRQWCVQSLFKL